MLVENIQWLKVHLVLSFVNSKITSEYSPWHNSGSNELLEWYLSLAKAASLGDAVTLGCHVTQGFAVDARRGAGSISISMRAGAASASPEA